MADVYEMFPVLTPSVLDNWLRDNAAVEFPTADLDEEGLLDLIRQSARGYILWCRMCRAIQHDLQQQGVALDMDAIRARIAILVESAEIDLETTLEESEVF